MSRFIASAGGFDIVSYRFSISRSNKGHCRFE